MPKGFSSYQAAWIVEPDEEDGSEADGGDVAEEEEEEMDMDTDDMGGKGGDVDMEGSEGRPDDNDGEGETAVEEDEDDWTVNDEEDTETIDMEAAELYDPPRKQKPSRCPSFNDLAGNGSAYDRKQLRT